MIAGMTGGGRRGRLPPKGASEATSVAVLTLRYLVSGFLPTKAKLKRDLPGLTG